MKNCKIISRTNNAESILENKLFQLANGIESLHNQYSQHFNKAQFIEEFGDYYQYSKDKLQSKDNINPVFEKRLDENGEPKLFQDKKKKSFYYLDKNNKKVYFPQKLKQLNNIVSDEDIQTISTQLAYDYLNNNFNMINNFTDIDLDVELSKTLKENIYNKLQSKIEELKDSDDFGDIARLAVLEEISDTKYLDEWVEQTKNRFKVIKLNYVEETEIEQLEEMEEVKDVTYGKSSVEKSYKVNINSDVKLMLSFIPKSTYENGKIVPVLDFFFQEPTYESFDNVYGYILGELSTVRAEFNEDIFEKYKEHLATKVRFKPYLKYLLQQFETEQVKNNENFKNAFVQSFTLDRQALLVTSVEQNSDGTFTVITQNVSEVGSRGKMILNEWGINFAEKFISKGKYNQSIIKKAEETLLKFQQGIKDITLDNFDTKKQELQKILKAFKFDTSLEGLDHYIFDPLTETTDESVRDRFDDLTQGLSWLLSGMSKEKIKPSENVPSSQKQINDLAKSEAIFTEDGSDASIYTKKNLWIYTKPSYISNRIKSWINNPQLLKQHIDSSAFNKGSVIGKYLLALDKIYNDPNSISKERLSKFKHGIFNLMQQVNDARNGVDSKEISKNDKIVEYVNKILAPVKGEEQWIDTPTAADKTTEISLNYGGFFVRGNVSIVNTKLESISDEIKDISWGYYVSEYNRMKEVATKIKESEESGDTSDLIVHYHLGNKNGLRSQLFSSLAPQFSKSGKVTLPQFKGIHLFDNNGYPLTLENGDYINLETKDSDGNFLYKDQIVDRMLPILEREIRATAHRLMGNKIIEFDSKNQIWKNNLLDTKVFNSYNKEFGRQAGANIAADIFLNGLIHQVEYSKLFSGDVAYYKDIVDYKKRIPATYTDGLQLVRLGIEEQNFNLSVIGGVKIPATNMEELKKILPKEIWESYENNNSTDAQGWITPQRWKFLMTKLGKWNSKYDTVYDKIMERNNKPFTVEELKMTAQPLKGVYFEINEQGVPTYLKYSQAVLIPSFIKNTPLQKIYDKMIEGTEGKDHTQDIKDFNKQHHELVTIDGVKVGAINPENIHNADGSLNPDFKLNKTSLKNSGWKLQQDLPTKGFKDTMIGTQIQKNIFQGLANNLTDTFSFQNKDVTGEYIAKEINRVIGELSNIGLESLKQELSIDSDGRITDLDSFYSALADQMIERDAPTNIVEALQANLSPLAIPQSYSKIMNMFASLVQKKVIKITTNGGSFIQVSEFGMNNTTAKQKGVVWTPWAEQTTNHYTVEKDAEDNDIKDALGRLKIKPASLLIPASLIAKYVPDWASKKPSELFGTKDKNYTNGIIDKQILENIIGYRIPNQGLSSNDAFSIAGILPEGMGDSVIAYTGITTKTGSDFDIDKMFLMVPSFENKDGKLTYVDSNKNSKKGLQNRLIELYKATILNPNVIQDVMQPLDFEYMSNDQKAFVEKQPLQDLDAFNPLKDIDTKFDYKAGKMGVGMEANALMDFVRGMMGNLTLTNLELTRGHKQGNDVKLDNEYSEEISKDEFTAYMELYNNNLPEGATKLTKDDFKSLESLKIGHSISAVLNAFVDIAKDNYITKANWNTFTTNTGNLLLRAGVHPFIVNGFLAQPILKKYVDFVNSNESITTDNTGDMFFKFKNELVSENLNNLKLNLPSLNINVGEFHKDYIKYEVNEKSLAKKLSIESLAKKLKVSQENPDLQKLSSAIRQEYSNIFMNDFGPFQYDLKKLKQNSLKSYNSVSEIEQLKVLEEFNKLQEVSKNIRDNMQASRTDTEGYGKNIPALFAKINLVNKILNNEKKGDAGSLKGFLTKMTFKGADSMLAHYMRNGVDFIQSVMENNSDIFTIAHKFILNTFNEISIDVKGDLLTDVEFGTKLENKYVSYMLSGFRPFQMTSEIKNEMIREFPNEFESFKNEHKQDYLILQELFIQQGNSFKFIVKGNKNKSSNDQNLLTNSWRRLLEDHPEMGEKLIKYSYLTSGFEMTKNQFFTLIPYEWFLQNDINTYLRENVDNLLEVDPHFIAQLYRNNAKDNVLVRQVFPSQKENSSAEGFKLNTQDKKANFYKKEVVKDENDEIIEIKLYELQGYDAELKPIYIRVNTLGHSDRKGNNIVNYQFNTSLQDKQKGLKLDQKKINSLLSEIQYPYDYYHKQMYNQNEIESNVDNMIESNQVEEVNEQNIKPKVDTTASWSNLKNQPVFTEQGINTMRTTNKEAEYAHFGNPFSAGGYAGTIKMPTVEAAAQAYKDWLLGNKVDITPTKTINIYAGANQNTELSNFANRPFKLDIEKLVAGEIDTGSATNFKTVEHAFQAAKYFYLNWNSDAPTVWNNEESSKVDNLIDRIIEAKTAAQAKKLGREIKLTKEQIEAWDNISANVMQNLIKASFEQNPKAAEKLLATGNAKITHTQDNTRWKTDFPEVVETVREMLAEEKGISLTTQINPEQRQWILEQINSGKLDNATLLYDSKLAGRGQGTHAHALAEVVEELRGGETTDYLKQRLLEEFEFNNDTGSLTNIQKEVIPSNYTNHSGGALGADSMFDTIGQEFGFVNNNHYWANNKTPKGNVELTKEQLEEGVEYAKKAAKVLNRPWNDKYANLLGRNWYQVKNSTQVIAIAPLIEPGQKNSKGFVSKAKRTTVDGGTGYAVEMAIANNKDVHVFDINKNQWFTWNGRQFIESETPTLQENFAGIGSRQNKGEMTKESIQAIRDVYEKTLSSSKNITSKTIQQGEQLNLFQQLNQQEIQDVFEQYFDRINKDSLTPMTLQEFMEVTKEFKTKQELINYIENCYPKN